MWPANLAVDFTVLLDTGSTDLWVYTQGKDVKFTNTTDLEADIMYGIGGIEGKIQFTEVQIGDFTIKNQGQYTSHHTASTTHHILQISISFHQRNRGDGHPTDRL